MLAEHEEGRSQEECLRIAQDPEESSKELIHDHWDWNDHNVNVLVQTRAQAAVEKAELDDIGEDAPEIKQEHSPNDENDTEEYVSSVTAQEANGTIVIPPPRSKKRKRNLDIERRQSPPIASWIGKQTLNQQIPVRQ